MKLFLLLCLALPAFGSSHRSDRRDNSGRLRCLACQRDPGGRIHRLTAARLAFRLANPCPATGDIVGACPGYVIDHVIALKRGGADAPANVQWQTVEDGRRKDRVE